MGPAFIRWLNEFSDFQRRRGAGRVPDPTRELKVLADKVDSLALEGLDSRASAACLVELERAALCIERRDYSATWTIAWNCHPSIALIGVARELFHCNRELLLGNVLLIRDANPSDAAPYFRRAVTASGPATPLIAGNAAINLGICQSLLDSPQEAILSYQVALQRYELAERPDKVAVALHSIGNAHRLLDEVHEAAHFIQEAINLFVQEKDDMGIWQAADDLSRTFLTISAQQPAERDRWIDLASKMCDMATAVGTEIWQAIQHDEGRLADLSDQFANHATTRCELAVLQENPIGFL